MKKVTHITYGLFLYKGIHFYRNLKDVVILMNYRHKRVGTPVVIPDYSTENSEKNEYVWNNILDRMIEYLSYMDESNSLYDDIDPKIKYEMMDYYKDKFFELYAKYFYDLWD